jgi:hypothetical protein
MQSGTGDRPSDTSSIIYFLINTMILAPLGYPGFPPPSVSELAKPLMGLRPTSESRGPIMNMAFYISILVDMPI